MKKFARMAKQADATDLKSVVRKDVRVRSPLRVPSFCTRGDLALPERASR